MLEVACEINSTLTNNFESYLSPDILNKKIVASHSLVITFDYYDYLSEIENQSVFGILSET